MTSLSVSTSRAELHRLLDAVARGDEDTLTRHGSPVAVVVRPDLLRVRRADATFAAAAEISELVAAGGHRPLPAQHGLSVERADQLVAEVRADRTGR